jgi:hypothetical protein
MNLGPPDYDQWKTTPPDGAPYSQEEFNWMLFVRNWLQNRIDRLPACVQDEANTFLNALEEEIDNA